MANQTQWLPATSSKLSPTARIKVDAAQTGFFEGREFRGFVEFDVALGATTVLRVTSPVDFILFEQKLQADQGHVRIEASRDGAAGGSWTPVTTIFGKNRMASRPTPFYVGQLTVDTGGTYTGGTLLEVLSCKADTNTNQAQSVGASASDERGLPAGTYYISIKGITASKGLYSLWWEERPVGINV